METLLHYVWKHKLYESGIFQTSEGISFEVIDPGIYNSCAGPDFFNAKIKIEDKVWAGNIEIHTASSEWYKHKHEKDKAYNSVILHVVEKMDMPEILDESGRSIPQWQMKIPNHVEINYLFLLNSDSSIPCLENLSEIPEIYLSDWKNALLIERLERKTNFLLQLLADYQNDWNEVFYIILARNFGFGINNDAFERLAKSLPLKIVLKHQNSILQVEALFLGQAGLLKEEDIADEYYQKLRTEYLFLQNKYGLKPLDVYIFKSLRIRPNNFPHIKIVQLASLVRKKQGLFSDILNLSDWDEFRSLFISDFDEYWLTHYHFEKTSARKPKQLGAQAVHVLVINTIIPLFFAYGKKKNTEAFEKKAIHLLESGKPEKNFIITLLSRAGIKIENAGDSQAMIQLKREYCEKRKCIFCRIGHKLLSR